MVTAHRAPACSLALRLPQRLLLLLALGAALVTGPAGCHRAAPQGAREPSESPAPPTPATTGAVGDEPAQQPAHPDSEVEAAATSVRDDAEATPPAAVAVQRDPGASVPPALAPEGAVDPALGAIVRRITAPIRECYARELARNPSFEGAVPPPSVRPVAGPRGPLRMELVGSSGSARVDRCLREAVRGMTFERDAREVHVQYPFLFTPEGEARTLPIGG